MNDRAEDVSSSAMSVPPMGLSGGHISSGGREESVTFLAGCCCNQVLLVVPATEGGEV